MSYSDHLPRKVKIKSRCFALLEDGAICKKEAVYEIAIHKSDTNIIDSSLKWARVFVCDNHIPAYEKSVINNSELNIHQ